MVDTENPDLTCPGDKTYACEAPAPSTDYTSFLAAGGSASDNCGLNVASFALVSEVTSGDPDSVTITRIYRIEDNCGNEATCEQVLTVEAVNIVTWVYLEGSAISIAGTETYTIPMRTSLNTLKVLPGQTYKKTFGGNVYTPPGQPYSGAPWNYGGNEGAYYDSHNIAIPGTANYPSTVVDWILVSLREDADGAALCTKAALLHNDGHVEFVSGGFDCCDINYDSSYFVVIEHRNHLIVMSKDSIPIINGNVTYDFRYTDSYVNDPFGFGFVGQKELLPNYPGVYGMFTGNGNQTQNINSDTDINLDDRTYWEGQNSTAGQYRNADFNMNADCNANDRTTLEFNLGQFSTVPRN
jgi:hypothetical protein